MIKKLLKNKLFLILLIIIIILITAKIFFKPSTKDITYQAPTPTPSLPNPTPNLTPYPQEDEIIDLNHEIPLARLLPYKGKYFIAKRYIHANDLEITVFDKSKTDLAKKEAQEWLVQNGVDTLDRFTVVY